MIVKRMVPALLLLELLFWTSTGHAAVYSSGLSNKSQITDLYREMVVEEIGASLYTANNFNGGYIGLAGHDVQSERWVNFSIWDNGDDGRNFVVAGPDERLGGVVERFGNEGTGAKTRTWLRWKTGVNYKTYAKAEHLAGGTLFSGWIGEASGGEWYLLGRIFRPDSTDYVGTGTVFLETLSDHEGTIPRKNGANLGWVRNSAGWAAMTGIRWHCQAGHIERASSENTSTMHYLTFERNNRSPWYPATSHDISGMTPTPSTAPDTMGPYTGPIIDLSDCGNQYSLSKSGWSLVYVDSAHDGRPGKLALDDDPSTYWETQWQVSSPPHPHYLDIDLGATHEISGVGLTARTDNVNGNIKKFEFYVSDTTSFAGSPAGSGSLGNVTGICLSDSFAPVSGRYVRLKALSEVNDQPWTALAEIDVYAGSAGDTDSGTRDSGTRDTRSDTGARDAAATDSRDAAGGAGDSAGAGDSGTRDTRPDTGARDAAATDSRDAAGGPGDSAGAGGNGGGAGASDAGSGGARGAGAGGRGGTAGASGGSSGGQHAAPDAGTAARDGAAGTGPASAGRAGCSCRAAGGDADGTSRGLALALLALALVSRSLRRRR